MPGGTYSALSGLKTRLAELDRVAADLANVNTAGYKTERSSTASSSRDSFGAALDSAIDVVPGATKIDFRPGTIATTGRSLDVAIDGKGFFVVETPAGDRYTRDGSFQRQPDGLLTTTHGEPVMGKSGQIKLPKGPVTINEDGTILSGTTVVGSLEVVEFTNESDLIRESGARFMAATGADFEEVDPKLVVGSLEQSNVSIVDRMAKLTEISRGFESLQRGVSTVMNDLDGRAITELGRR